MRKYDVVYILKDRAGPDELRYSLRSIEQNLNHGTVWFYGYCPPGFVPDEYVPHNQSGTVKWERVRSSMIEVCRNNKISKKFWLFNDDFFVLAPMEKQTALHRGLLTDHIKDVEARHYNQSTGYTRMLRACEEQLKQAGQTTLDYALHVPMLIDREKMLQALEMFPRCPMFRSLYGNYAKIGGDYHKDVKTTDATKEIPTDADFFSTSNRAFAGYVREQMDKRFPDPCKYEEGYIEAVESDG